jgi:PTS system fructose-specific IIC component
MAQLIAIAASKSGAAQAFMLGEALRIGAERLGHSVRLQVISPLGTDAAVSAQELAAADLVLLAADIDIDRRGLTAERVVELAPQAVLADPEAAVSAALAARLRPATASAASTPALRIVAVTSCPTGVAHTFMAAEALQQAARALGHTIRVETQGSVGAQNTLSAAEIAAADLVLIAADTQVERARFVGKRLHVASTKAAIRDAAGLIAQAAQAASAWRDPAATAAAGPATIAAATPTPHSGRGGATLARAAITGPYKHLLTGVSYMLPFVVAGGLLIALSFALGGIYVYQEANEGTLGWVLFQIGAKGGFALMVPALAGFIAYSIADRPGLAPGMIGGLLANTVGAGFLGGIAAGFVAGYAVAALNRWIRLPRTLEALKPVLILPLLGTAVVGVAMLMLLGEPVAGVLQALTDGLRGMQTSHAVLLGVLIGAMMAFDMGGPVNKAAYVFSTTLIASGVGGPMAAAMAAGMVPPLGIALACWWFGSRFNSEEREAAKPAAVLGLSFITEGAIPFAARDPLRVIPACMLGSATAGGLSMLWSVALQAPHGGVFVLAIPNAVNHLLPYAAAILAGMVVTALALAVLKRPLVAAMPGAVG